MKKNISLNPDACIVSFFIFLIFLILLPSAFRVPSPDSGTFLYMGQQILDGALLYRDLWDHKPPMVYLLNALGLFIGRGSPAGVVLLEFIMVSAAIFLCFFILNKAFGRFSAFFGTFVFLIGYTAHFEGGNFTEEYALFFQFLILYLLSAVRKDQCLAWRGVLIGVLIGCCFLLRQNLIGVGLGVGIYFLLKNFLSKRWDLLFFDSLSLIAGALLPLLLTAIFFFRHNAQELLFDATFLYNFAYTCSSILVKIRTAMAGCFNYIWTPYMFAGWVAAMFYLLKRGAEIADNAHALLFVASIILPIEIAFSGLHHIRYPHYYLAWIPAAAVLTSFFAYYLLQCSRQVSVNRESSNFIPPGMCNFAWVIPLLLSLIIFEKSIFLVKELLFKYRNFISPSKKIVEYIKKTTSENNYILMWGYENFAYFLGNRKSPTKYFFQYALFTHGYSDFETANDFMKDIEACPPAIIVETYNYKMPPIDPVEREKWLAEKDVNGEIRALSHMLEPFYEYVMSNYRVVDIVDQWPVYQIKKIPD